MICKFEIINIGIYIGLTIINAFLIYMIIIAKRLYKKIKDKDYYPMP